MIGWSVATRDVTAIGIEPQPAVPGDGRSVVQQGRSIRIESILVNVLVSLFYGFFLYSSVKFWLKTGSPVGMGLIVFNTLSVACLLTRRNASIVTASIANWILASLTPVAPLLLRPVGSSSGILVVVSSAGQILALVVMVASLIVLNRSIGIVAANRGIKTRGPYAWIRHPLYAGEILFDLSFLLSNWSHRNGLLVFVVIFAQVVRSLQEERLLVRDERYVQYRAKVPYRLVPGVF
jgi:protein-S-isoprenylcysteine O-methyltransferase Ste14